MKISPIFKNFFPYLFLVTFGFLLYYQTLSFSFSYLDDNRLIIDNSQILHDGGLTKIFTSDVFFSTNGSDFYYRPLLNVSLLLDSYWDGANPFFFHYTNLILHLLATCLVFLLLKNYLPAKNTAFFLSLIFLTHPVLTQAVAWIPGRNDSLLTIFVVASLTLFIYFLKNNKISYFWGHLIFMTLALFTKETAVFLPLICLTYYFLFAKPFSEEDKRDTFLIIAATWFCSLSVWYLFRTVSLSASSSLSDLFISVLQNLPAALVYIGKIIFPINLSIYPIHLNSNYWLGLLALLLMITAYYFTPKVNWRRFSFGLLWFVIFLLPSFLSPDGGATSTFLEHRLYLPIIGFLLICAEFYPFIDINFNHKKTLLIATIIIGIFSVLTFSHSRYFSDRISFWNQAVIDSPQSAFVHNNLGAMYYLDGDLVQAQAQYETALQIDQNQRLVHNNLGLIAYGLNNLDIAKSEYQKELAINPYYDVAWVNLGILFLKSNNFSEAKKYFQTALQINPNNQPAYNYLLILSSKVE